MGRWWRRRPTVTSRRRFAEGRSRSNATCRFNLRARDRSVMNRRTFLGALAVVSGSRAIAQPLPPVRAITKGPRFHWFGYYDKLQFDPTSRFALGASNDFQHRLVTAADRMKVGMVDLENGDKWIEFGETKSWSWHQTCMLQWLPGSKDEVIWNDRQGSN